MSSTCYVPSCGPVLLLAGWIVARQVVEYIQGIIDNGYAYESNGSVYFNVQVRKRNTVLCLLCGGGRFLLLAQAAANAATRGFLAVAVLFCFRTI